MTNKTSDKMIVRYCPECGGYSGETMELLNPKANYNEEILRCNCGWEGKWKDLETKEIRKSIFDRNVFDLPWYHKLWVAPAYFMLRVFNSVMIWVKKRLQ